jgi:hypothetical protein
MKYQHHSNKVVYLSQRRQFAEHIDESDTVNHIAGSWLH